MKGNKMDFKEYIDLPQADENCELCKGEGEVQCCRGESYYYDECDCVMVKHYKSEKYLDLKRERRPTPPLRWLKITL